MTSKQLTHKMTTPISVATQFNGGINNPMSPAKLTPLPYRNSQNCKTNSPRSVVPVIGPSTPTTSKDPLNIRIKRNNANPSPNVNQTPKSAQKSYEVKNFNEFTEVSNEDGNKGTSLVSIVCDYLSAQHSLCKNPMVTCPEFDLFAHHKCPDPRPKHSAPWNFASR